MNKEEFKLWKKDMSNGHEDYWFEVSGTTRDYLTDKYTDMMCIKGVFRVVYSKDEDVVGVEITFPFSYSVVVSNDEELRKILIDLVNEL